MKYEFHPLANLFPLLSENELEALKEDIKKNGQRVPIAIYQGQILDGRNRWMICEELGIKPKFEEPEIKNPFCFVLSVNLYRRQLTDSQKAMMAVGLANMRQGERTDLKLSEHVPKVSQVEVAKMFGIRDRLIRQAKTIREKGTPEQIKLVEDGLETISKILREINKKEGDRKKETGKTNDATKDKVKKNSNEGCEPAPVDVHACETNHENSQENPDYCSLEIINWKCLKQLPSDSIRVSKVIAFLRLFDGELDERHQSKLHGGLQEILREKNIPVDMISVNVPVK